jgi:hypothetical protein
MAFLKADCGFNKVDKLLVGVNIELLIDMANMGLDSILGDTQGIFYVAAAAPAHKQDEDFCLAGRQPVGICDAGAGAVDEVEIGL